MPFLAHIKPDSTWLRGFLYWLCCSMSVLGRPCALGRSCRWLVQLFIWLPAHWYLPWLGLMHTDNRVYCQNPRLLYSLFLVGSSSGPRSWLESYVLEVIHKEVRSPETRTSHFHTASMSHHSLRPVVGPFPSPPRCQPSLCSNLSGWHRDHATRLLPLTGWKRVLPRKST